MEKMIEIVGEEVIHQQNSFRRVRRWIKGWHPELGLLTFGYTGPETVMEVDLIRPMGTYIVTEFNLLSPDGNCPPQSAGSIPPLSDCPAPQLDGASCPPEHETLPPSIAA